MLNTTYWLTLIVVVFFPIYLAVRYVKGSALLPLILYGLSLLAFLVLGLPMESARLERGVSFNLLYFITILLATIPLYSLCLMCSNRKLFPKDKVNVLESDLTYNKLEMIVFILIWLLAMFGVALYFIKVGYPPLFGENLNDLLGSTQKIKNIRKAYTYTASFREYKLYFYTIPVLAAILGHLLYLKGRLSSITNLIFSFRFFKKNAIGLTIWVSLSFEVINFNKQGFFSAINSNLIFLGIVMLSVYFVLKFILSVPIFSSENKLKQLNC